MNQTIPASRVTQTHWTSCVASGDQIAAMFTKPIEPVNWVEDFLQVIPGPGSTGFSRRIRNEEQHACPACDSTETDKLVHVPNAAGWGLDYSCRCGADYNDEDIDWGPSIERIRAKITDQTKVDFTYWWDRSAPAEAQPVYDEDHYLAAVVLGDERVER